VKAIDKTPRATNRRDDFSAINFLSIYYLGYLN
jgi:hypothetical protein